jgi:hypothetical protein
LSGLVVDEKTLQIGREEGAGSDGHHDVLWQRRRNRLLAVAHSLWARVGVISVFVAVATVAVVLAAVVVGTVASIAVVAVVVAAHQRCGRRRAV